MRSLRSALDRRDALERRRRRRRLGDPAPPTGRRQGLQEVLADEVADETGGTAEDQSRGQRVFGSSGRGRLMNREFWDSELGSGTIFARKVRHANERTARNSGKIRDSQSRGVAQPGSAPALGEEPAESWPAFSCDPANSQRIR